jgi:hypothetical protein
MLLAVFWGQGCEYVNMGICPQHLVDIMTCTRKSWQWSRRPGAPPTLLTSCLWLHAVRMHLGNETPFVSCTAQSNASTYLLRIGTSAQQTRGYSGAKTRGASFVVRVASRDTLFPTQAKAGQILNASHIRRFSCCAAWGVNWPRHTSGDSFGWGGRRTGRTCDTGSGGPISGPGADLACGRVQVWAQHFMIFASAQAGVYRSMHSAGCYCCTSHTFSGKFRILVEADSFHEEARKPPLTTFV